MSPVILALSFLLLRQDFCTSFVPVCVPVPESALDSGTGTGTKNAHFGCGYAAL